MGDLLKFFGFKTLTYKRFYNTHAAKIFLNDNIHFIIGAENSFKKRKSPAHNLPEANSENGDACQEDKRKLPVDTEGRQQREYEHYRAAHSQTDNHLVSILHIGNVGSEAGNNACGGEPVYTGKGKVLHVIVHVLT